MDKKIPIPTEQELREADKSFGIIHLISGKTGKGEDFYAYISVTPSRYEDFLLISHAKEQMDLSEFGEILESGFGTDPSPEVQQYMKENYNVDPDFIANLQKMAAQ